MDLVFGLVGGAKHCEIPVCPNIDSFYNFSEIFSIHHNLIKQNHSKVL